MKKIFAICLAFSFLAMLALPVYALPTDPTDPNKKLPPGPQNAAELMAIIDTVTNWIFAVFVIISIVMVILSGLQFVTAGGDAAKVSEARQKLIWAAVGIIVALAAKGLVPVLRNITGLVAS